MKKVMVVIGKDNYLTKVEKDLNLDAVNEVFSNHFKEGICNKVTFYPVIEKDEFLVDPDTGEIFENVKKLY